MTIERREPATTADERTMLEGWLDYHRQTLALKCEGLDWDAAFRDVPTADVAEAFRLWRAECDHATVLVAAAPSLDVRGFRHSGYVSLRWVLTHMIEEYARHNRHADLLRERLDGSVGELYTERAWYPAPGTPNRCRPHFRAVH